MSFRRIWIAVMVLSLIAAGFAYLPTLFLPKRWLDIQPGQTRTAVHTVLGTPDTGLAVKGFDSWHNPFGAGASVLTVSYNEDSSRVVSTRIETKWGTWYRSWAQDYKRRLTNDPAAPNRVDPLDAANSAH